jgi:hypothetical protein
MAVLVGILIGTVVAYTIIAVDQHLRRRERRKHFLTRWEERRRHSHSSDHRTHRRGGSQTVNAVYLCLGLDIFDRQIAFYVELTEEDLGEVWNIAEQHRNIQSITAVQLVQNVEGVMT